MEKFSMVIPMLSVKHHGGTRILLQLANSLVKNGHSITILTPKDKYVPIYPVNKKIKMKFTSRVGNNRLFYLKTLIEFIFKIPKSDFILANFFPTFYPSLLAEKLGKGKIVYFPQGIGVTYLNISKIISWFLKFSENITFKFKTPIVVTARWQTQEIVKINKESFVKIINIGLPNNIFYPDPNPKLINNKKGKAILYFLSKLKSKGLKDFLEALKLIKKNKLKFDLWLVGNQQQGLESFNYFKNTTPIKVFPYLKNKELREVYSSADLYVNTSWLEGFCLPPLEAMACGIPVVLTDSLGPREYAIDNYNCLMVPPRKPELLARAISKMLLDKNMRQKITENGIKTVEKFKFSKTAEEFEKFLLNLQ